MRAGTEEGTGALLAWPLVKAASAMLCDMASFDRRGRVAGLADARCPCLCPAGRTIPDAPAPARARLYARAVVPRAWLFCQCRAGAWAGLGRAVFGAAALVWAQPLAALLTLAAGLVITGALHEDGLADCLDGLGGGRDRDPRACHYARQPDRQLWCAGVGADAGVAGGYAGLGPRDNRDRRACHWPYAGPRDDGPCPWPRALSARERGRKRAGQAAWPCRMGGNGSGHGFGRSGRVAILGRGWRGKRNLGAASSPVAYGASGRCTGWAATQAIPWARCIAWH